MSAQKPDEQGEGSRVCKEVVVRVFPVVLEAFEELKRHASRMRRSPCFFR